MESGSKRLIVIPTLLLAASLAGCAQTHYSDGTKAGYCIGASCLVKAIMPAAAMDVGRNPNGDFVRPSLDAFKLGQATYGQVVDKMGNPTSIRTEPNPDGTKLKIITYSYVAANAKDALNSAVPPARELAMYFLIPIGGDGGFTSAYTSNRYKLVGQKFSSTFPSDDANYDDTKISGIVKGKSNLAEVVQVLGNPSAAFVTPMVKDASGEIEAIEYTSAGTSGEAGVGSKTLRIAFDDKGLASDIGYTSSDKKQ